MKTIAVIGSGFSGTATVLQLLRRPAPNGLHVILINRSGRMARGVAYGTRSNRHILNVPAGNMSVFPEDVDHFVRFCRWHNPLVTPSSFVSRHLYGRYLDYLLEQAEEESGEKKRLTRVDAEVIGIDFGGLSDDASSNVTIQMRGGAAIIADRAVLAFGHFSPLDPAVPGSLSFSENRYIRDPWAPGALDQIGGSERVLLIGSGLTAIDVAATLAVNNPERQCIAVSRRGLLPQPHRCTRTEQPTHIDVRGILDQMGRNVRRYVRVLRRCARSQAEAGKDWRDVISLLRPHIPELWRRLNQRERRRFLRHIQPYWDVHRHRLAPEANLYLHGLLSAGTLQILAGRLVALRTSDAIEVDVRKRSADEITTLEVDRVVNCTGPGANLHRVNEVFPRRLLEEGMLRVDPLGLGIEVDAQYRVVDGAGRANESLRYIGPLLRATYWEATAVPELRVHARKLAEFLLP
ncbi:FAD/NAD(P)-binding protein [Paraburkholderia sacchari]|uniref:FAD/NAD(P)-binding protein n=1 Tax=Paraburkholderia sacchari TaxID=159450 RepID=UPI000541D708|nr:FAD/NAD(P)-binding protein [Paraburkholderia sacchari]NLP64852.1 FAD-dependent oxidoreductase [Paraburkholderia sacchari]